MPKSEGAVALSRFVKYCEAEAAGLNLAFVAYCLAIADGALAEEFGFEDAAEPMAKMRRN